MPPSPHILGKKRIAYWDWPLRRKELLTTLALPGVLAVGIPSGIGLARQQSGLLYGPVAADAWSRPWFLIAGLALVIFMSLAIYRLLRSRQRLVIYEQGIELRHPPRPARALRWSELAGIAFSQTQPKFPGLSLKTRSQAVLIPNVGRPIRLHSTASELVTLVDHLKTALYPRLSPSLEEAFRGQKWVYFGPVAIHPSALRMGGHEAGWETVQRVSVQAGRLVVELRQDQSRPRSLAAPIVQIPNLELLLDLISKEAPA